MGEKHALDDISFLKFNASVFFTYTGNGCGLAAAHPWLT